MTAPVSHRRRSSGLDARAGLAAVAIALCSALGCSRGPTTPQSVAVVCGDPLASLAIYVTDASTGRAIASNTTAIATLSPIYADTARAGAAYPDTSPLLAGYHSGTFRVVVARSGYASSTRDSIVVKPAPAPCEGNPLERVRVDVRLEPVQ